MMVQGERPSLFFSGRIRGWTWAHRFSQAAFLALLLISARFDLEWVQGNTAATRLLGVLHLVDPLSALEVALAGRHLPFGLLAAAGILFLLYALLGRAFCGWVCPLGLALDLTEDARRRFITKRSGKRLPRQIKYVLLAVFLLISFLSGMPVFTFISPINILTRNVIFGMGPEIALVLAVVAFDLFYARRAWCRSLCPLGAFYSLIGRFAFLRVRIRNRGAGCTTCGSCIRECPMGINVLKDDVLPGHTMVSDPECTRCGTCLEGCEGGSLFIGFARREKGGASAV